MAEKLIPNCYFHYYIAYYYSPHGLSIPGKEFSLSDLFRSIGAPGHRCTGAHWDPGRKNPCPGHLKPQAGEWGTHVLLYNPLSIFCRLIPCFSAKPVRIMVSAPSPVTLQAVPKLSCRAKIVSIRAVPVSLNPRTHQWQILPGGHRTKAWFPWTGYNRKVS